MSGSRLQQRFAALIGLDWSDQKHDICMRLPSGRTECTVIGSTPEELGQWVAGLRRRFAGRPVAVALETSRGPVIHALMCHGLIVLYPVNPKSLARFREALRPSGAKDDPNDAEALSLMLERIPERLRAFQPEPAETRKMAMLCRKRRWAVERRTALANRLKAELKGFFPQALRWLRCPHSAPALRLLSRRPSLQRLRRVRPKALPAMLQRFGFSRRRAAALAVQIAQAQPLTEDQAVVAVGELEVPMLCRLILELNQNIAAFDREIDAAFDRHADHHCFRSLPGAGKVLAPRLLAAFGTRPERWRSAREIGQFSGIAPVLWQSGNSRSVRFRRACPKFLRQTFHEFAACSIPHCRWAKLYYDSQRAAGKEHHAAVRALAYKWLRILFPMWRSGQAYDDVRYCRALSRSGSPLAKALAQDLA